MENECDKKKVGIVSWAFLAFAIVVMMAADAWSWGSPQPKKPAPTPVEQPVKITDPGYIQSRTNVSGTVSQAMRITRLAKTAEAIVNTDKFKTRVLGAYYKGKLRFVDTNLSNAEVYQKIREAKEVGGEVDYIMDLDIGIDKTDCNTLGWTYPTIRKFYFNSCGFDERSDAGLTGTICHEWTHKLGFSHVAMRLPSRAYSVPYSIGTICSELYDEVVKAHNE